MNLLELSKETGIQLDVLKDEILDQFGIIILSEYSNLQQIVVDHYSSSFKHNKQVAHKNKKNPNENSSSEESECLDELIGIQQPKVTYTKKFLKYCIDNRFLIFVDTCSLLNDNFMDFYRIYIDQRGSLMGNIYIPYVVIEELKRIIIEKKKEQNVIQRAIEVLQFVEKEETKHNIVLVGDENDKRANERGEKVIHADRVIIEKLIFFRNDSRSSLFITQDFDATIDALKQNDWHSSKSKALILVKKIIKGGALVDNTKETVNPALPIDK